MSGDALDFWIGTWDAVWDGGSGINTVTRELGGHIVVERFEAGPPEPFSGLSVSAHERSSGLWRQTWVDSTGSYWAFVGGPLHDGSFVFATAERVDVEQVFKRMVFSGIGPDAFDWRWEFSADGHRWEPRWSIRYTRRQQQSG